VQLQIDNCKLTIANWQSVVIILAFVFTAPAAIAAEITSNGTGGGRWDDAATWRAKKVPSAADEVVIAKDDIVVYDRDDDGKTTCKQLFLDPRGKLTFKGGGKRTLIVDGPVESHGMIQMDASKSADDYFELRVVAEKLDEREIRLKKGAALTLSGRPKLPDGKRNVVLSSKPPMGKPNVSMAPGNFVNKDPGVSIELQHSQISDWTCYFTSVDNTGSKPGERMNINGCRFNGQSRIVFNGCDTPTITNTVFDEQPGGGVFPYAAVHLYGSPLAEVKNVTVRGYVYGVMGQVQSESVVVGCTFEKCDIGVYWYGTNGMLRDLTIRQCGTGIVTTSMSGSLENIAIEKCRTGYAHAGATVQATNLVIKDVPKDGTVLQYASGGLTLLNCPIRPEDVKFSDLKGLADLKPMYVPIEWLYFAIVDVKGKLPEESTVTARTVGLALAPGAEDPNVRNSPAPLVQGRTPLPKSTQALTLRAEQINVAGKIVPAPMYALNVYAPPEKDGAAPKLLKTMNVTPSAQWYRPKPDAPMPTLELPLP